MLSRLYLISPEPAILLLIMSRIMAVLKNWRIHIFENADYN